MRETSQLFQGNMIPNLSVRISSVTRGRRNVSVESVNLGVSVVRLCPAQISQARIESELVVLFGIAGSSSIFLRRIAGS